MMLATLLTGLTDLLRLLLANNHGLLFCKIGERAHQR